MSLNNKYDAMDFLKHSMRIVGEINDIAMGLSNNIGRTTMADYDSFVSQVTNINASLNQIRSTLSDIGMVLGQTADFSKKVMDEKDIFQRVNQIRK